MVQTEAQARSAAQVRRRRDVQAMVRAARDRYRIEQPPCWLCGQAIDYTISDTDNDGHLEVDHMFEISEYPEHAADPENARPAHRGCNRARNLTPGFVGGAGEPTSEDWENIHL